MHAMVSIGVLDLLDAFLTKYLLRRGVEALTRVGQYDKTMLPKAVAMFEVSSTHKFQLASLIDHYQDFLQYLNHVGLCTEEVSEAGEG